MTIYIEAESGSLQGQHFEFDHTCKTIIFGRSDTAQIQFPADETTISRQHLSLDWKNDRYQLNMQDDNPVYLDGREAFPGDELALGEHVLILGHRKDGPQFRIAVRSMDEHLPKTEPIYEKRVSARASSKRSAIWLSVAIMVLAGIGGAGYWVLERQNEEVLAYIQKIAEKEEPVSFESEIAKLRQSVYLVAATNGDRLIGMGTAWVVGENQLATNAHVVEGLEEIVDDSNGEYEVIVISPQGPDHEKIPVIEMKSHPHYSKFSSEQRRLARFTADNSELYLNEAYDVGLLTVSDGAKLAPELSIASMSDMYSLDAGQPVAFVGYPMEDAAGGGTDLHRPTPQLQSGHITSVTDYFMVSGDEQRNQLIQHNLPAHGGASGSPIFNEEGHVVALFNAGNVIHVDGHRVGTGIGVNFGQRADVLQELINDSFSQIEESRFAFWGGRLAEYKAIDSILLSEWQGQVKQDYKQVSFETIIEWEGRLTPHPKADVYMAKIPLPPIDAVSIMAIGMSPTNEDIDLYFFEGTSENSSPLDADRENDSYPVIVSEPGSEFDSKRENLFVVIGSVPETISFRLYAAIE